MKKKIILSSILALGVLGGVVGVAHSQIQVEAADLKANTYVYFEKPDTWTKKTVAFLIGHDTYSIDYAMTQISNTDIYYLKTDAWSGYTQFGFMNNDAVWGGEGNGSSSAPVNRIQWASFKTNVAYASGLALDNTYNLFGGSDTDPYANTTKGTSYSSLNATVNIIAENGGTASASGYKLSSATAVTKNEGSSISALKFTDVTLTATVNDGYEFEGWYDSETATTPISTSLTYTVSDIKENKTYYAKYKNLVNEEAVELLTSYYSEGTYTRNTTINLNTDALDDISTHFHGSVVLERTTYFTPEALWMTRGETETNYSYYGTSGENMTTGSATELGEVPTSVGIVTNTHKDWANPEEEGMEGFYITLKDIMEKASTVEWTYSNGVYSTTGLTEEFLAFTAPCLLDTQNYVQYTGVEVEEVGETLVLRLLASETNSGALSVETNVLSQAVVTK